jgi:predicted amidophosphoribosyltransferase
LRAAAGATGLCASCWRALDRQPGLASASLVALGRYRGGLGRAVRAGKFRPNPTLLQALGEHLALRVARAWPEVRGWTLLPLPADPRRRRRRGIDHTVEVARGLSRALQSWAGAEVTTAVGLVRTRPAATQSTQARTQRLANVAWTMRWYGDLPEPVGKLLLIDDVLTSGASAREARRALAAAGLTVDRMAVIATAGGEQHAQL